MEGYQAFKLMRVQYADYNGFWELELHVHDLEVGYKCVTVILLHSVNLNSHQTHASGIF